MCVCVCVHVSIGVPYFEWNARIKEVSVNRQCVWNGQRECFLKLSVPLSVGEVDYWNSLGDIARTLPIVGLLY